MVAIAAMVFLAAPAAKPRAAAIVVGGDVASAGELQSALDARLAAMGAGIPSAEVAQKLAVTAPVRVRDPGAAARSAQLFEKATLDYYRDRAAQAHDGFDQIAALQAADSFTPLSERVRLQLWRMAVFLALKDKDQADAAALGALALDPKLEIDTKEFPPSMQDALSEMRLRRLRTITILVTGLPAGAKATLDGRLTGTRFDVGAGAHRLVASGPGRREMIRNFDAGADLSLKAPLPLLLDSALESALTSEAPRAASPVAAKIGADWIAIATLSGTRARVRVVNVKGDVIGATDLPKDPEGIASWVEHTLAPKLPPPAVEATPIARATPRAVQPVALHTRIDAGVAFAARSRSVSGTGGTPYKNAFNGVGPSIDASFSSGAFAADAFVQYLDYSISYLDVQTAPGVHEKLKGGSSLLAGAGADARLRFDRGDPDSGFASLGVRVESETLTAKDVNVSAGTPSGAVPSSNRLAAMIRAGVRVPLRPAMLDLAVAAAPYSSLHETPSGTTGTSPKSTLDATVTAGLSFAPSARSVISLVYEGGFRGATFSGTASAPIGGGISKAKQSESIQSARICASMRF